jgi:hypothetical protein
MCQSVRKRQLLPTAYRRVYVQNGSSCAYRVTIRRRQPIVDSSVLGERAVVTGLAIPAVMWTTPRGHETAAATESLAHRRPE